MRYAILAVASLGLLGSGLVPAKQQAAPGKPAVAFVVLGEKLARLELSIEIEGRTLAQVWDETFALLFAFHDTDGDGGLSRAEAARLPSPLALRQAMGVGFAPPIGTAPVWEALDADGNGRVVCAEMSALYRREGIGHVLVGVGRLPATTELTETLLKYLDANADGKVDEAEWKSAPTILQKLDRNDDELIGAGEVVPKTLYPGAAGTVLLTSPRSGTDTSGVLAKLPLIRLPELDDDMYWAEVVASRMADKPRAQKLLSWRRLLSPDESWLLRVGARPQRFTFRAGRIRIDAWNVEGKLPESMATIRKQFLDRFQSGELVRKEAPPPEPIQGRRAPGLDWLIAAADRDTDGAVSEKEILAWLDLQEQITRGQFLLTVLDGAGLFELLDTDHDGALSHRELRNAWLQVRETGCLEDGSFDRSRIPQTLLMTLSRGYPQSVTTPRATGPTWFRAMDRNGDGDVSRREFTGPASIFDRIDIDRDGLLSPVEAEGLKPTP